MIAKPQKYQWIKIKQKILQSIQTQMFQRKYSISYIFRYHFSPLYVRSPYICSFQICLRSFNSFLGFILIPNNQMQGEMTVTMLQEYPFMACKEAAKNKTVNFVKKIIQYGVESRFSIKQKLRMVKNLGFQGFIGLEKTLEEENTLNLMFECVPFKFQEQVVDMDEDRVERVKNMMYDLADNLVNHCVQHEFKVRNIGLDRRNGLKYFLGLNFIIDKAMRKQDTLQRYRRIIDYFFARGGPVIRGKSPSKSFRNECRQTEDTSYKLSYSQEPNHLFVPAAANIMKKSATVPQDKMVFGNEPRHILNRYTFNCQNALSIPNQDRKNYDFQKHVETKVIKIDELGSRINKLKSYIKQISGRTPTSSGGLARLTVHVDANNSENKIFQENKIMITPSYTKLQKKISQFRQAKLYRAYNEKEILYSKNNHGYQVHTTQRLQDNRPVMMDSIQTEPVKTNYQRVNHVPSYLLQKNQITSKKQIQSPKNHLTHVPSTGSAQKIKEQQHINAFHNSGRQQSMNSSKALISEPDSPKLKQYRMLATKDKYCQQFMFFLEDDEQGIPQPSTPGSFKNIPQIEPTIKQQNLTKALNNNQIQDRVKKAIRNSIKLINDLKTKDTTA